MQYIQCSALFGGFKFGHFLLKTSPNFPAKCTCIWYSSDVTVSSICLLCFVVLQLLHEAGIMATYIYSSLDQTARKINVAKFVNKKVMVMIVTDVAVS